MISDRKWTAQHWISSIMSAVELKKHLLDFLPYLCFDILPQYVGWCNLWATCLSQGTSQTGQNCKDSAFLHWFVLHSLTHCGRVTHICVSKLIIIGSDNGLLPDRCQAIIWTNTGILLIGPLWINFSEILLNILTFSFKKMHLKVSSVKWQPFCLGLNVLNGCT